MSNTATVTPYESGGSNIASGIGSVAAACTAATISFLMEKTPEDELALERVKDQRRKELLITAKPTVMKLRISDTRSLMRAATQLGYRMEAPLKSVTKIAKSPYLLMRNSQGQKLALKTTPSGLVALSNSGRNSIQSVVRQHTVQAAVKHLSSKMAGVKTRKLANGVIEIEAKELNTNQAGGPAKLKAHVFSDGTTKIDISEVKGNRCEKILSEFAEAIGGNPVKVEKKPSYFQLAVEPTKKMLRI